MNSWEKRSADVHRSILSTAPAALGFACSQSTPGQVLLSRCFNHYGLYLVGRKETAVGMCHGTFTPICSPQQHKTQTHTSQSSALMHTLLLWPGGDVTNLKPDVSKCWTSEAGSHCAAHPHKGKDLDTHQGTSSLIVKAAHPVYYCLIDCTEWKKQVQVW